MKKELLFCMTAFMLLTFSACGGGDDDPVDPTPKQEETPTITIDSSVTTNGLAFTSESGEKEMSFTANAPWTLSVAATRSVSWCTPSQTSGNAGTFTIKFTVTANDTYDDRSVSITLKCGTVSKTFTITQKAVDALLLTTDKYEISQEGGIIEVEVKANISYEMEIAASAKDWITQASTRGLTARTYKFSIAANEELEQRKGEIHFKSGEKLETVKVYQSGATPTLMLGQKEITVSDAGETISVDIKSNVEYSVQMPSVDWITEAATRGMSSHTLKFTVQPNTDYDSRTAQIIFMEKSGSLKDTLTVTQVQKDAIVLAEKEMTVEAKGGALTVKLKANVDVTTTIADDCKDWITLPATRGLVDKDVTLQIAENTSYDARTGSVTFSANGLSETMKITQKPQTGLLLEQKEITVSDKGETITVKLKSNIDFTVQMPSVDWITAANTRGLTDHTLQYTVKPNETYDSRTAQIIFAEKNGSLKDTLTVIQAQKGAIILSKKKYEASSLGDTIEVEYNTNVDCVVEIPSDCSWIAQIEANTRGLSLRKSCFKIAANPNATPRSENIVIRDANTQLADTVSVVQEGSDCYLILPGHEDEKYGSVCDYKGGMFSIKVEANGPYVFDIIAEDSSWIHKISSEKTGENTYIENFFVDENNTDKERQCYLQFSLGPIVRKHRFSQNQKRELFFSQTEIYATSEGGEFPLTIKTDGEWALNMSPLYVFQVLNEASSWLSVENDLKPCVQEDVARIVVQPNLTATPRSAYILFAAFAGEKYNIKVSQSAQGAVVLSQSKYILSSDTHTLTVNMAPSDYSVEIDNAASSWISLGSKTGTGDQTKQEIVISQNTTGKERNGIITFSTADAKNQVTVTQLMAPPVLVDDTPEKWKQFQLPAVRLTFKNPDSDGSQIYKAIVPDCEELVNIASRKVLNSLYDDPTNSLIPRQKELEYALEDFDGISYNAGGGLKIALSNQYLANYYKTYGAEAMIKENIGILTHELTHSYQLQPKGCGGYQEGTHFWVFIEGVADAVRTLNGGFPNDSDRPRGGSYMSGYRYTGFFLAWLVNNKDKDFLRKFNRSANEINPWSFDAGIKYALGEQYSADELWTEYQKAMGDI